MRTIKSAFLGAATMLLLVGSVMAGPIQFGLVQLDPTGVGAFPTGGNQQQICPTGVPCAGNNFLSPAGNSFAVQMLTPGLFSASITDIESPGGSATVNQLDFAIYNAANVLIGSGSHFSNLNDIYLGTGLYTMYVTYNVTGGPDAGSVSWAMTMATSVQNKTPEPGSLALVGIALAGMGLFRRRKLS